jgi:hypothetical protein
MGKRELLLVGVFILLGIGVYQFTAPPADPSRPGFSIGRLINEARREIRGQRESAQGTETRTIAVSGAVREIRVGLSTGAITITGEDRADVQLDLQVRSTGYDQAEADRLVKDTIGRLKVDEAGALLILNQTFPAAGRQTATLNLRVPARLGVRMDAKGGVLKIAGVASVTIGTARGETNISQVAGEVTILQRGSVLTIDTAGSVRVNAQAGAEVRLANVRLSSNLTFQSGELRAERLAGGLEVESRNADLRFERLEQLRGSIRLNVVGGELALAGLESEARIDARQAEVRIDLTAPAPLAVYNDGEAIELTLPKGGIRLDAMATDGRISLDPVLEKEGLKVDAPAEASQGESPESRLTAPVRGGGPVVTLRNTRADIVLRSR